MLKIEIKNRWTGTIIFEFTKEGNTVKDTVLEYIKQELAAGKYRANLTGANLTDADLTRADLTGANLTDANLTGANLTDANLTGANLTDANLTGANLTGANLTDADLTDANLTGANLTGANLTDANLTGANLTDADLTDADLTRFKNDLWRVLLHAKAEIAGLRQLLVNGKINGTKYQGSCCCLKGTISNLASYPIENIGLINDVSEPSEQWFLQIKEGDTPENSGVVRLTVEWIDEFIMLLNK